MIQSQYSQHAEQPSWVEIPSFPPKKGKPSFSPVCLLNSHTITILTAFRTPDIWGLISLQAILRETSWVPCSLTQFWHCLEVVSNPKGWGLGSTRLSWFLSSHFPCQFQFRAPPELLTDWLLIEDSPDPSPLWVQLICHQLIEFRKTVAYFYQFSKEYDKWIQINRQIHKAESGSVSQDRSFCPSDWAASPVI